MAIEPQPIDLARSAVNRLVAAAETLAVKKVFGERVFTYPMRSMFSQTMVFADSGAIRDFWRQLQLRFYTQLSAGNAFVGCQYFTVRGIRTLNGKIVQHALSRYYSAHPDQDNAPIPSKISYFHFMDESYHFNVRMPRTVKYWQPTKALPADSWV